MKTILIELGLVEAIDWIDQVGEVRYREMHNVYRAKGEVEVICKAVDGDTPESSYYDVKLPSGSTVDALQGFHLKGIHNFVEKIEEPYPLGIGAQYVIDVQYPAFRAGMEIDHNTMELLIKEAIEKRLNAVAKRSKAIKGAHVMWIGYETDYPIPGLEDL